MARIEETLAVKSVKVLDHRILAEKLQKMIQRIFAEEEKLPILAQ